MLHSVLRRRAFKARVRGVCLPTLLLSAALLAGRQTTLSLEEAKKITASFEGKGFVPPPRTINDITEFLGKHAATGNETLNVMLARADSEPPADVTGSALGEFYLFRAEAARMLGRHKQGIMDATKAIPLTPEPRGPLVVLQTIHEELGNYAEAAEFARRSLEYSEGTGGAIFDNGLLSIALGLLGDLEGAGAALGRVNRQLPETYNWNLPYGPYARAFGSLVEGHLLYLMGSNSEAEASRRETVAMLDDQIASGWGETDRDMRGRTLGDVRRQVRAGSLRFLALSLMLQGRLAEAEVAARDAVVDQLRLYGRNSGQTVEGLGALTEVLNEQGRYEEAATLARITVDIFGRMGAEKDSATLADGPADPGRGLCRYGPLERGARPVRPHQGRARIRSRDVLTSICHQSRLGGGVVGFRADKRSARHRPESLHTQSASNGGETL